MDLFNIIYTVAGGIGGIVLSFVAKLGDGWVKEIFENRKQERADKKQAAKDINTFCVEGMHKSFRIRAGSEQHIKLRATEIEAIDIDTGTKLRQFLYAWSQCRNILKRNPITLNDEKLAKEYRDSAQKLGDGLIITARGWAKTTSFRLSLSRFCSKTLLWLNT